jgi:hypothetical protein
VIQLPNLKHSDFSIHRNKYFPAQGKEIVFQMSRKKLREYFTFYFMRVTLESEGRVIGLSNIKMEKYMAHTEQKEDLFTNQFPFDRECYFLYDNDEKVGVFEFSICFHEHK